MSGSNYTVTCPKCQAENLVRGKAMTLAMTCQKCHYYFRTGGWNKTIISFEGNSNPDIPIGSKGKIDNTVYEVMGFVVKKEREYRYTWREYLLFNPYVGYAFLSEYDGNWNFIWAIEDDPKRGSIDTSFYHGEDQFRLFQKYSADVIFARGEFFFDVVEISDTTLVREYISPPYLFELEESDDSLLWCQGEYMTPEEVAGAFSIPVGKLPKKRGLGYTQPLTTSITDASMVGISAALIGLVILLQIVFAQVADEKVVYNGTYNQSQLVDQKFFVTPSFTLEGGSESVEIEITSPMDNDWFYADFTLINESTGNEVNFTKEMEYYHGYEDGYSWAEGATRATAFLSSIPGGPYHINIYPEFGSNSHQFSFIVKRDVVTYSNFFIAVVLLILFPVGYFIRNHVLEKKRWSESDYSPYHLSDE